MARVLVVDDEPDILLMLRIALETEGHDPTLAADGESALARLDDESFDCVLLDLMMPVMDGLEVMNRLRGRPHAPPVVVFSAKSSIDDMVRAFESGATDYLLKPFSPAGLARLIETVVALSPEGREAHRASRLRGLSLRP